MGNYYIRSIIQGIKTFDFLFLTIQGVKSGKFCMKILIL